MHRCIAICFAVVGISTAWGQSNCRLYIADQYDWGAQLGFYLDLEGPELSQLPLILAVADGQNWRFATHAPGFVPDRDYTVRATITPEGAELFLDGQQVGVSPGSWKPASVPLQANYRPPWADEQGDWIGIVSRVTVAVTRAGQEANRRAFDFSKLAARPVPLQLFEPGQPESAPLDTKPGDSIATDVVIRFAKQDLRAMSPFIDRYGQCRYADWPEKVRSDEDLRIDIEREDEELTKMPPSEDFDEYGGYAKAAWREQPTGFFRVLRRDGYWWLISPSGNPCFYMGVCSFPAQTWPTTPVSDRGFLFQWLPPREGASAAAWSRNQWGVQDGTDYVCLHTANLIRKYGEEGWLQKAEALGIRRLKAWGFSGGAKWGAPASLVSTPVLNAGRTPRIARHPDVFDPAVCEVFRQELERQIAPRREDPHVLGWSLGNEYDEIITPGEVTDILGKPAGTPAKRALVDHALQELYRGSVKDMADAWGIAAADPAALYAATPKPPADDVEKLRQFYADRYYGFIYGTVKSIDPNHLYLGFWIVPGWWVNESDWALAAPHCDVIGYDRYSREYADELLARLQRQTDKPTLCGEFNFPPWYDGLRGFGRYGAYSRDDAEAGELYYQWARGATRDPYCVGLMWFQYRDQPLTGRGPGRGERLTFGEHYAFGLITGTDRPKWAMVRRMREANLRAASWRLAPP